MGVKDDVILYVLSALTLESSWIQDLLSTRVNLFVSNFPILARVRRIEMWPFSQYCSSLLLILTLSNETMCILPLCSFYYENVEWPPYLLCIIFWAPPQYLGMLKGLEKLSKFVTVICDKVANKNCPILIKHCRFANVANWSKRVKNGPKWPIYLLLIIWDHFGSIWTFGLFHLFFTQNHFAQRALWVHLIGVGISTFFACQPIWWRF